MIVWIFVALFAAAVNYVCTAVNFSFARMRKKYIEDNDELDAEKVEKVAPYYQKTSVVLAGTQIGYLFCSSIFALSLYQSVRHMVLFWEETNFFSAVLVYAGVSAYIVIALMLYWIFTILVPGSISLVRPLSMLSSYTWFINLSGRLWKPFIFIGLFAVKKILDMKGIPCRDEVNFTYTEDEIRCIVEESHRGGRLNTLENTLIKNSFDFFDLDVRDVMIPRNDMVVLDFNDDMDVMRRNISKTHHTCYPVCMEDKDHILGFIHVKDFLESLLRGEYNIKRIMREILTVPEVMPAPALLQMMKNKRTYLAVVVDEYGGTSGLVTLEDLMEELAGEIPQNESNAPAEILRVNDHVYEFDGTVILEDVSERLQMEFDDEERNNTIGGLIFSKLERIPQVGDHVSFGGWKFTVLKMYGFRIMRVKAEMDRKEETEPDSHE